jgi:hypothetical protein
MMDLLEKVEKKYGPLNTEWVAEKGKVHETRLIKELALEVDRLQRATDKFKGLYSEAYRDAVRAKSSNKQEVAELKNTISRAVSCLVNAKINIQNNLEIMDEIVEVE